MHTALFIPAADNQPIDDSVQIDVSYSDEEPIGTRIKKQVAKFLKVEPTELSERSTPLGTIYSKTNSTEKNGRLTKVITRRAGKNSADLTFKGDAVLVRR